MRWLVSLLILSPALGQNLDDVILPEKTTIFLTLERTINTETASPGDGVHGRVSVPVTVDDRIVVPVGSHVIGRVETARGSGYVKGKAKLIVLFDTFILPNGTTRKMEAVVQSAEGYRSDYKGETGQLEPSGSQTGETVSGATKGGIAGATIGALSGRDLKGAGVGAAIGSGVGALLGLFSKGQQVVLRRGTSMEIQLNSDVRLVKPRPRNPGIPLGN